MSKNNGEEQEPKEKSEDILDKTKQDDSKNKKEDITKIKTKEEIKTKNNKKSLWLIILFSVLVVFLLVISVIFALININNEKILDNVTIMGIDVSDLTKEEAKKAVTEVVDAKLAEELVLKKDEYETSTNRNHRPWRYFRKTYQRIACLPAGVDRCRL